MVCDAAHIKDSPTKEGDSNKNKETTNIESENSALYEAHLNRPSNKEGSNQMERRTIVEGGDVALNPTASRPCRQRRCPTIKGFFYS